MDKFGDDLAKVRGSVAKIEGYLLRPSVANSPDGPGEQR